MPELQGKKDGIGQRHALVVSRWNQFITIRLRESALEALKEHGVIEDNIDIIHVNGAFELGPIALLAAKSRRYDAVTCLGAVIRGETAHFEHVASQAARLVAQAFYDSGIPVIFGVLTTDTVDQALERAAEREDNKGYEAALAAIEMVNVCDHFR